MLGLTLPAQPSPLTSKWQSLPHTGLDGQCAQPLSACPYSAPFPLHINFLLYAGVRGRSGAAPRAQPPSLCTSPSCCMQVSGADQELPQELKLALLDKSVYGPEVRVWWARASNRQGMRATQGASMQRVGHPCANFETTKVWNSVCV